MIGKLFFWSFVAVCCVGAWKFCAALLEGRKLSDEPRGSAPDSDQFPHTLFHDGSFSEGVQRDHAGK